MGKEKKEERWRTVNIINNLFQFDPLVVYFISDEKIAAFLISYNNGFKTRECSGILFC